MDDNLLSGFAAHAAVGADKMGMLDTIAGGIEATVVDAGVTIFNSLTPAAMEVDTADLLSRIDQNALQVYNEHTDTIRTASFIAGTVIPVGLSLKGMQALRAGSKAVNWFSKVGETASLARVEEAFKAGAGLSREFKKAKTDFYIRAAINGIADNAAAEAAIMLAMNDHPYMEDYFKDFGYNFTMNMAIGSVLGAGINGIVARGQVKGALMGVEKEYTTLAKDLTASTEAPMTTGVQMQQLSQNVKNIKDFLASDAAKDVSSFTREHLGLLAERHESYMIRAFKEASTEEIKALDAPTQEFLRNMLTDTRFAGFENVGFFHVADEVKTAQKKGFLQGLQDTWDFVTKTKAEAGNEILQNNKGVYSPVFDRFMSVAEAENHSTIADLGKNIDQLLKGVDNQVGAVARGDAYLAHGFENSAKVEADYASAMLLMESKSLSDLTAKTIVISPSDLATQKAVYARLTQLLKNGEDISKVKMVLTDAVPTWGESSILIKKQLEGAGFSREYLKNISDLNLNRSKYQLYDGRRWKSLVDDISSTTEKLMKDWLNGDYNRLRSAAVEFGHEAYGVKVGDDAAVKALMEMYNHPRSKAFREMLHANKDGEGYVLLYRGMNNASKGRLPLESYSLNSGKASAFAKGDTGLRMYKVHVDDIVCTLEDFGTTVDPNHSNMEILVINKHATRENAAVPRFSEGAAPSKFFSDEGELLAPKVEQIAEGQKKVNFGISYAELKDHIWETTKKAIKGMQTDNLGLESIAIRTGTPLEQVERIIATNPSYIDADDLLKFRDKLSVEQAMDVKNRSLLLAGNKNKVANSNMQAALNESTFASLGQQWVEYYLLSSKSDFVRQIGANLLSTENRQHLFWMEKEVDSILSTGVGSTFFRSTNSALESLGPVGKMITSFGKNVTNLKNHAKETFTKPLSEALSDVAKNDAHVLEFNHAINLQASVTGKKVYKARKFWTVTEHNVKNIDEIIKMSDEEFSLYRSGAGDKAPLREVATRNGMEFTVATDSVDKALTKLQDSGRQLYHLKNTHYQASGKGILSDIGFWAPANNPRGKQVAYVFDMETHETTMLMAKTDDELISAIRKYRNTLSAEKNAVTEIVTKDRQAQFNALQNRHDPMYMKVADAGQLHGGSSATAQVSTTLDPMAELIQGYDHYINQGIDNIVSMQLNPILDKLENLDKMATVGYSEATLNEIQTMASGKVLKGSVIANTLMGRNSLDQYRVWQKMQSSMVAMSNMALERMSGILSHYVGKGHRTDADWIKMMEEMKRAGIVNPFATIEAQLNKELVGQIKEPVVKQGWEHLKDSYIGVSAINNGAATPRLVALMNATAATMVLRFGELAQPLVNILSLPILTSGAINKQLASSFMGAELNTSAKFSTVAAMHDGIRLMHSKHADKWYKLAADNHILTEDWREVNGIFQDIRRLEPSAVSKAEQLLDSKLVTMASKASDWAEKEVRRATYFTAVGIAKKAYPNLSDAGVVAFARNFMDEAIGNYAAAQRPALFQGTVGVAMGLFQTYMVTMAQQMYRQIETRNFKALAKMMLMQQSIFGSASLPGFHQVSTFIGEHYSDDNYDLQTGTFRALPNKLAEVMLYGLPSQFVGITTRGDIQPRLPNPLDGVSAIAAANLTMQAYTAGERVAKAALSADKNTGMAMLEALSLQSISRPIARISEVLAGHSMTGSGQLVATDLNTADNLLSMGTLSRVFATRPLEEIKLREAMHLDSYYGSVDRDKRKATTFKLKSYIENGNLDQAKLGELANEYMRTGTPTGWRSAVNEAVAQANRPGSATVREHLSPNTPLMQMINDLD